MEHLSLSVAKHTARGQDGRGGGGSSGGGGGGAGPAQSSTNEEQLLLAEELAPIVDRMGRLMTDIAPHLKAMVTKSQYVQTMGIDGGIDGETVSGGPAAGDDRVEAESEATAQVTGGVAGLRVDSHTAPTLPETETSSGQSSLAPRPLTTPPRSPRLAGATTPGSAPSTPVHDRTPAVQMQSPNRYTNLVSVPPPAAAGVTNSRQRTFDIHIHAYVTPFAGGSAGSIGRGGNRRGSSQAAAPRTLTASDMSDVSDTALDTQSAVTNAEVETDGVETDEASFVHRRSLRRSTTGNGSNGATSSPSQLPDFRSDDSSSVTSPVSSVASGSPRDSGLRGDYMEDSAGYDAEDSISSSTSSLATTLLGAAIASGSAGGARSASASGIFSSLQRLTPPLPSSENSSTDQGQQALPLRPQPAELGRQSGRGGVGSSDGGASNDSSRNLNAPTAAEVAAEAAAEAEVAAEIAAAVQREYDLFVGGAGGGNVSNMPSSGDEDDDEEDSSQQVD
eukprot:INCI18826.1.p1 GENE.INCI18826.1~~INCI18826.1.p1  ORF type:complete len:505 (+),score=97.13 INCI18826.1:163-1677(+)